MIDAPSPNYDDRRGRGISLVVLHYTGMRTGEEALARLRDPDAGVSAHYLVEEDGRVYRLVDEENRAWHAGVSWWGGVADVNSASIGVELVNPGHDWGYRDFPEPQIASLVALLGDIEVRRPLIGPASVIGHSDVAPARKSDPGEKFPWSRLAEAGLALGPARGVGVDPGPEAAGEALRRIGYRAEPDTLEDDVHAFQRRFLPRALGAGFNSATRVAAAEIAGRLRTAPFDGLRSTAP